MLATYLPVKLTEIFQVYLVSLTQMTISKRQMSLLTSRLFFQHTKFLTKKNWCPRYVISILLE